MIKAFELSGDTRCLITYHEPYVIKNSEPVLTAEGLVKCRTLVVAVEIQQPYVNDHGVTIIHTMQLTPNAALRLSDRLREVIASEPQPITLQEYQDNL